MAMDSKGQDPVDLMDDAEDVNFEHKSSNPEDYVFDSIVSTLEELLMDDKFQELQNEFGDRHCDVFEESKENKLEYMEIFNEYSNRIEGVIETALKKKVPGITMKQVEQILEARHEELAGEIFDMLHSLGDFLEFKDLMLSFKRAKAINASKSLDLSIAGRHV